MHCVEGRWRGQVALRLLLGAAAIFGVAVAILISGCGSSDSSGSSGSTIKTSSLSRDEFIKQAGAACQKARKNILQEVLAYTRKHEPKNSTSAQARETFTDMSKAVVVPIIREEIAAIEKLGAPSGEEDEVGAFVSAERHEVEEIAKKKILVSRFELERYLGPSAKLAREYGLDDCANA